MAVKIIYTVFSCKKENGRFFHPKSLFISSNIFSAAPPLVVVFDNSFVGGSPVVSRYRPVGKIIAKKGICLSRVVFFAYLLRTDRFFRPRKEYSRYCKPPHRTGLSKRFPTLLLPLPDWKAPRNAVP